MTVAGPDFQFEERSADVDAAVAALEKLDGGRPKGGSRGEGGSRREPAEKAEKPGKAAAARAAGNDDQPAPDSEAPDTERDEPESEAPRVRRRGPAAGAPEREADEAAPESKAPESGDDDDDDAPESEAPDSEAPESGEPDEEPEPEPESEPPGSEEPESEAPKAKRLTREEAKKLQARLDREYRERRDERRALAAERARLEQRKATLERERQAGHAVLSAHSRDLELVQRLRAGLRANDPAVLVELGADVGELFVNYHASTTPEGRAQAAEKRRAEQEAQQRQQQAQAQEQAQQAANQREQAFFVGEAGKLAKELPFAARLARKDPDQLYALGVRASKLLQAKGEAYDAAVLLRHIDAHMSDLAGAGKKGHTASDARRRPSRRPPAHSERRSQASVSERTREGVRAGKGRPKSGGLESRSRSSATVRARDLTNLTDEQRQALAAAKLDKLTRLHALTLTSLSLAFLTLGEPMPAATVTSLNAIHKILYPNGDLPKQVMYGTDPFFAEVKKNTKFGGQSIAFPYQFRGGANTGSTVALAQTNTAPNGYNGFVVPASARKQRHGVAQWERQAIRATMVAGDRGAFVRGYQREVDGQTYALARDLAKDLWGTGGMALGQVGSGQGTPTITLLDTDTIVNFEVGMVVQAADADPGVSGSGTVRVGSATIIGLNRGTGQITVSGNWTASITSLAANDFLFQQGDIVSGDYAIGGRGLRGIQAWIPLTAPSSTLFFNVDRTQDSTRQAGYRLDCRGLTIEEAIRQLGLFLGREGGRANRVYLSMKNWHKLMNEGSNRTLIQVGPTDQKGKLVFGYNACEIVTSAGTVKVVAGANVPNDRIYMLNLSDWELASLDECPTVVKDDGLNFVRQASSNIFELRLVYDAALICYNPGSQAVAQVSLPTL